jgi:hypothetical protein
MYTNVGHVATNNKSALGHLLEAQTAIAPLHLEEASRNINARRFVDAIGSLFAGVKETNASTEKVQEAAPLNQVDTLTALLQGIRDAGGLLVEAEDKTQGMIHIANLGLDHADIYREDL